MKLVKHSCCVRQESFLQVPEIRSRYIEAEVRKRLVEKELRTKTVQL